MNKESMEKKSENDGVEKAEGPVSFEGEDVAREIIVKSKKEVDDFVKNGNDQLQEIERRAVESGLIIDPMDIKELKELEKNAKEAQHDLENEINPSHDASKSQQENIKIKNICSRCGREGKENHKFCEECGQKMESIKACPGCGMGNKLGNKFCEDCGNKFENKPEPSPSPDDGKIWTPDSNFPPPITDEDGEPPQFSGENNGELALSLDEEKEHRMPDYKNASEMQDRVVENPELIDKEEASKKFLAEERAMLIKEIRAEREKHKKTLLDLGDEIARENIFSESLNDNKEDVQYRKLAERQSEEASAMAERLSSDNELSEKDARDEEVNLEQLIANSEGIEEIKKKVEEHYAKADEIAQKKFESIRKTVEQTMIRNKAFIVHTFLLDESLRHNDNSNISRRATLSDDMDMLLSLEPSVSSSSVIPGVRQGLWGEQIGVVFGGGDIRGIAQDDDLTRTGGIRYRNGRISSSEEIDEKVSDKEERGYNELVVNNPKVFGFFKNVSVNETGEMSGFHPQSKNLAERKNDFMYPMNLAREKGMPLLIMTPDRRLFEFINIADNGVVTVGAEISPEQVAKGKAGLIGEKRKEIGERVISKNLFKYIDHQREAKEIITELSGLGGDEAELSREEYLSYAKDNPERLDTLPGELLEDKQFVMEVAKSDPVTVYRQAAKILKTDIEFIKYIYSLKKKGDTDSMYLWMPEEMKKNESVALLAIENDDFKKIDFDFADSSLVWKKIIDKMVEKTSLDKWAHLKVGEYTYYTPGLNMTKGFNSIDMSEKIISDNDFIQKLKDRYPNYKLEVDNRNINKQLKITKLA